ncbi:MAG: hypothetical protein PHW56_04185 [Methanosarcinaceae archaeon]|nr:hypothetical protein [Methanosarcinaceae archaeon]
MNTGDQAQKEGKETQRPRWQKILPALIGIGVIFFLNYAMGALLIGIYFAVILANLVEKLLSKH